MEELLQTVTNATRAAYLQMLHLRTLTEGPFQILMMSLEYQEDAINGQLRPTLMRHIMHDEFSKNPLHHKPSHNVGAGHKDELRSKGFYDDRLRNLAHKDQEDQMNLCFAVSWQYIMSLLNHPRSFLFRLYQRHVVKYKRVWLQGEWRLLKRDVEVTLGFVMTHEQVLHDIDWLENFEQQVQVPIDDVIRDAKYTAMYKLLNHDPSMFALFEHVLCARLVVLSQTHLLEEMVEEGFISDDDFKHIQKTVLDPTVLALEKFTPSGEMLAEASGMNRHHFVSTNHCFFNILDFLDGLDAQ